MKILLVLMKINLGCMVCTCDLTQIKSTVEKCLILKWSITTVLV